MKWNLPAGMFILGLYHHVEVREFTDEESADGKYGLYLPDTRTILIDADTPPHLRYEIFCHEVGEAINDMLDLGMKHNQISGMGLGFHDVFRNQLIAWTGDVINEQQLEG